MSGLCDGRVCIVTGAGRGIGREYALMLAAEGASVVVNDLGGAVDGAGRSTDPAADVVREITAAGGRAVSDTNDISSTAGAEALVAGALESFGGLDVLVNNAGILRDNMLVNMSPENWEAVISVHLSGTFATSRQAARWWREESKAGRQRDARIINTTSASGIYGNVGQSNYGAAKAGIAALTVISSMELQRYGVTANAIAPLAVTRMTENLRERTPEQTAARQPRWVAPVVTWLASVQSASVTGRVLEVSGDGIAVAEGWRRGPQGPPATDPREVGEILPDLLARAQPNSGMDGIPGVPRA